MSRPPLNGWGPGPNKLKENQVNKIRSSLFKRLNDLGKPKRPITGYDVFYRNTWHELKSRRPDLDQVQIFSEIGRIWREGTCWEDRQICYDYADWEKEIYDREVKVWRRKRETEKQEKNKFERQKVAKDEFQVDAVEFDEKQENEVQSSPNEEPKHDCRQQ